MRVFRDVVRDQGVELKPVAAELVFDGSRLVFTYQAEQRPDATRLQAALRERLHRRVELRSVGPRECARLCGDHGLCGGGQCSRRYPTHEQPVTLRMAKDQDLPMSSGRITGLCGRLRCCLAYEHPMYRSFRDRAPRVGGRVQTPQGHGVVKSYEVLKVANETRHIMLINFQVVSAKWFDSLPRELQQALVEECDKAGEETSKRIFKLEAEVEADLKKRGMTIVKDVDLAAFRKAGDQAYATLKIQDAKNQVHKEIGK